MIVSVSEKLKIVRNVLVNVGGDIVFHYRRPAGTKRFVVWQEDAQETALHVNNASKEIVLTGTIDFFTPNEFDTLIDDIAAGRKYMKVYRQMKMYNDADTNPVLYGSKQ